MTQTIRKAMVLAAGLGTRLRPLTLTTPKPLLPVHGKPLLDHILQALAAAGVTHVALNLHHLPDQIRAHVGDGSRYGVRTHFSFEPVILGTGGGLKQCADFLGDDDYFLVNGDIFAAVDFAALTAHHQPGTTAATLVVRTLQAGETHTPVAVDAAGRLRGIGQGTLHYAGIMLGTPRLLAQLPTGVSCVIRDGIVPLLAQGTTITTSLHSGTWNDIGTPEAYEQVR